MGRHETVKMPSNLSSEWEMGGEFVSVSACFQVYSTLFYYENSSKAAMLSYALWRSSYLKEPRNPQSHNHWSAEFHQYYMSEEGSRSFFIKSLDDYGFVRDQEPGDLAKLCLDTDLQELWENKCCFKLLNFGIIC